jgi:hypothetical protein
MWCLLRWMSRSAGGGGGGAGGGGGGGGGGGAGSRAGGGGPRGRAGSAARGRTEARCCACAESCESFPKCFENNCSACALCTLQWYRSQRAPTCVNCGVPASRAQIRKTISISKAIGETMGPLREVGPEEEARWLGVEPPAAQPRTPLSPRSSSRAARDYRALKREAPKIGVKECPACGESIQHFKNDGCHSVVSRSAPCASSLSRRLLSPS